MWVPETLSCLSVPVTDRCGGQVQEFVCAVRRQTAPAPACMGVLAAEPVRRSAWSGLPLRNRCSPPASPAVAGSGRTPPVKHVGEPRAGELHARIDGRALERNNPERAAAVPGPVWLRNATTMVWAGTTPPDTDVTAPALDPTNLKDRPFGDFGLGEPSAQGSDCAVVGMVGVGHFDSSSGASLIGFGPL